MKNKKWLLLPILAICIVIMVVGIIASKTKNIEKENNNKEYICNKRNEWTNFEFKSENGEDLGQYRWEYTISFSIKDNKEILNAKTEEKYYFTNHLGYDSLEREIKSDFKEQLDEENLIKIYTSDNFTPIKFANYASNEEALKKYIRDIKSLGYTCEEL